MNSKKVIVNCQRLGSVAIYFNMMIHPQFGDIFYRRRLKPTANGLVTHQVRLFSPAF